MQTFSKMRRSGTLQASISFFLAFLIFALYIFLTDVYVVLPLFLGILFLCFCSAVQERKTRNLFFILLCLFWLELDKGLPFGSLILLFVLAYVCFYFPCVYFLQKAFYIKFFCVCLIYLCSAILCYFSSSFVDFANFITLISVYIFIEGMVVFLNETKN